MEESEISSGAPPDANAPPEDPSVNISSIFHDDSENKKVIVLQSPGLENENAMQVQGELPNLMDAVSQPGDVTGEQNVQVTTEITYETQNQSAESVETVSAVEETNNMLNVSVTEGSNMEVTEAGNMEVTEYVPQVITDHNIPEGQELIYLDPDDIKDQNIQFIDVSETQEMVTAYQGNIPTDAVAQAFQHAVTDTELPTIKQENVPIPAPLPRKPKPNQPKPNQSAQKDDSRTRFLCPVCEKSFRQKHLLLCHIKLHDGRPKSNSVYMSNCTTCGGNVRLTSEQARLLQERGTEDARIICSTCKILGHDVIQQQKTVPIELKPAFNFACDMCGCDIKLTDDQLQLVERKGAENIRIICAPCSTKDVETDENTSNDVDEVKCNVCHRKIVLSSRDTVNRTNPTCAECQAKGEDAMAVDKINPIDDTFTSNCSMCHKELFFAEKPGREVKVVCESCKNKKLLPKLQTLQPVVESPVKPVESLAVMYKCNTCFCNMQLSVEQKELLRVRGVSGTKIICSSCHAKESAKPASAKKPRLSSRTYQCDVCLMDMSMDYTPKDDDDIICTTCRRVEEKEQNKNKVGPKRLSNDNKTPSPSSINRCCTCNKALPLSRAQVQKLLQKGNRARVKCLACNRKTEEELRKTKKIIKTEDTVDYRCEICSISFGQRFDDFTDHFSRVHVPESDLERAGKGLHKSKKALIHCPICDAAFTDRVNLKMHMNTHKPVEQIRISMPQKPCPLCCKMFDQIQMNAHYKKFHKIDITTLHYTFKSSEEFKEWKTNQEVSNDLKFVAGEPRAAVLRGRSGLVVTLRCQYAVKKGGNKYPRVLCPAMMKVHERPCGRFDVEYVETHVGHGDLSNFPEEDQQLIVEMVKGGSPVEEIIDELYKHYNDPESEDLLRSVSGLKSLNLIAVRRELGVDTGIKEDSSSGDEDNVKDTDLEGNVLRYVDLPESLSWLKEEDPAENGQDPEDEMNQKLQHEAIVDIHDTGEGYQLRFQSPSNASKDEFSAKKIEILRRLTDVLNKCSCDEHLEIVDVYLNPCEQTLHELSSGRTVEIVDEEVGSPGDENLPTSNEESDTAAPPERSKNELLENDTT
uniref:Transcriptional repressor CTCFL n=2 Tax=Lygus hesperus TaxID=30085 RepID=A0A0A9WPN6_LYGHE